MKNRFTKKLLTDLRVELMDEFDRNFERKAFFTTKPWPGRRHGRKGTLLNVRGGGGLRGSLKAAVGDFSVTFTSGLPYASIHNEGGKITVTAKMKRFFWAKYYEAQGGITFNIKKREVANTRKNKALTEDAEFYKSLALMKIGSVITMPERRFIGHAPEVDQAVKRVIDANFNEIETMLKDRLKQPKI
ncbi:hypothetical protein MASR1M74_02400 [Lentimicrobium sp.]